MIFYLILTGIAAVYNIIYGVHCLRSKRYSAMAGALVMVAVLGAALWSLGAAL